MIYYSNNSGVSENVSPKLDIIEVADPRFPGGTSFAVAQELKLLSRMEYSFAFVPYFGKNLASHKTAWNNVITSCLDELPLKDNKINNGKINSRIIIFHNPVSLKSLNYQDLQISAEYCLIVAHHPPADSRSLLYYDPVQIEENIRPFASDQIIWAPVSPVCRDAFTKTTSGLKILESDWHNTFPEDEWAQKKYSLGPDRKPVIGRHSRPIYKKWPDNLQDIMYAYPDTGEFDIKILGWKENSIECMPYPPAGWNVYFYNELPVRHFLESLDFYVYFHHPLWRESFGRNVAEAILTGIPCILPRDLEATFGPSAIYARPEEVKKIIKSLWNDKSEYLRHANQAREIFIREYGEGIFVENLKTMYRGINNGNIVSLYSKMNTISQPRFKINRLIYYLRGSKSFKYLSGLKKSMR